MKRMLCSVVMVLVTTACASVKLPVEAPEIEIGQLRTSRLVQERGGTMTIEYLLQIENRAEVPLTVERIELQTIGGSPYTIRQLPIDRNDLIEAGETEVLELSVWAYSYGGVMSADEPITIRVTIRFNSPEGAFQINKVKRIIQR